MKSFDQLARQALNHHPGTPLEALLGPRARRSKELVQVSDDRALSAMTWRIFCAGLKRSVVDAKWPAFEKAFFGFDPQKVSLMSDEHLEKLMQNRDLIRHLGKIKATRLNALMVDEASRKAGGFGRFLADWPVEDTVGLWLFFKKEGSQLGGNSAAYALRIIGRDTPVLTDDVVTALKAQGVVDKRPSAQRDLRLVQEAFNTWQKQSGVDQCQISRLLAHSIG
ncbi:MAG TPA: DNA-3-methyladenine glycosylase I [Marinobacterium sp.]|nr:DNA-3-methyladenine glycosylase I [Marinobacterium sp.]